ncbi:DUF808 family protein [Mucilaginibacter sabulilitoris]|uniref:DUF808 family protein n=1 Tax=Mucilaginibacter sabulilitoris TaxID=1173583 RepID=A0ABZ0TRS8_9SPHI|nr:DUF808 family protein [Mucilaginibacter sabulilitoris]WPU95656.1 DUF808 family protein [Mucilaginibacter sabulilitoris]
MGTVLEKTLPLQILTVTAVAILATIGVYGIVALIVRMDGVLVKALPVIIKLLGFVGTIALILVACGIFLHNIEYLHRLFSKFPSILAEFLLGLAAGLIMVIALAGGKRVLSLFK